MSIEISGRRIGVNYKPFIIAEMSGNHNNELDRAIALVDAAAEAGVDALKIQTATPDGITLNLSSEDFTINDSSSLWDGRTLYNLYKEAVTPWEWHEIIFDRCKHHGLIAFSSPFELGAIDFLETLDVPCYKIASFELVDLPLIKKAASTGKPIIMSTGMASVSEIQDAIFAARSVGNDQIILLKCTSSYPASPVDSNLRTIEHLRDLFGTEVGLSDHTMGVAAPCASVAFGATVIEKHFTLSRDEGGVDSAFSLEPSELKLLVVETERAWQALGAVAYGQGNSEGKSMMFRRSLYICEDVKKGEVLTENNLRIIRPGFGIEPKYYDLLIGRKVNKILKKGARMSWEHIG
jgi:N-acetylneuraminate synthase